MDDLDLPYLVRAAIEVALEDECASMEPRVAADGSITEREQENFRNNRRIDLDQPLIVAQAVWLAGGMIEQLTGSRPPIVDEFLDLILTDGAKVIGERLSVAYEGHEFSIAVLRDTLWRAGRYLNAVKRNN